MGAQFDLSNNEQKNVFTKWGKFEKMSDY